MLPSKPIVEVCVESADAAVDAARAGADRVELCQSLLEGGTTPSAGSIARAVADCTAEVIVLVRPRGGDFLYTDGEIDVLCRDVLATKALGAAGVALGVLRADGSVDIEATRRLVDAARPMSVTFHRAFDMTRDAFASLDALIDLGVDRVLTSGQAPDVVAGIDLLRQLVERSAGRIQILPGGGVREHNVREVLSRTGATEIHFRAASRTESGMKHRNPLCRMGSGQPAGEFEIERTDPERVRSLLAALAADG